MIDLCFYLYQKSFPLYPFALFVCLQYMQLNTQCIYKNTTFHNLIVPELRCSYLYPVRYSFIIFEQIILEFFDSIWWSELIGNGVFIFEIIIIASHLGDIQVFVKKLVMSSVLPYRKTNDKMWNIFRNVEWCSSKLALVNIQQTGYKMALIVQLPTVFLPDKVCEELMIPFFFVRTEHSLLSTSWFGDLRQHGL